MSYDRSRLAVTKLADSKRVLLVNVYVPGIAPFIIFTNVLNHLSIFTITVIFIFIFELNIVRVADINDYRPENWFRVQLILSIARSG
jgi:hypothetical protein